MRRALLLAVVLAVFVPSTAQAAGTTWKETRVVVPTQTWTDGSYGEVLFLIFKSGGAFGDDGQGDMEFRWQGVVQELAGDEPLTFTWEADHPGRWHQRGLRSARLKATISDCVYMEAPDDEPCVTDLPGIIRLRVTGFGRITTWSDGLHTYESRQGTVVGTFTAGGHELPGGDFSAGTATLTRMIVD